MPRLQRLQVQPDGRDRRLQLVRDGVDEGVVLLVALDLHHEEHGVDDQAGDDEGEEDDAEDERRDRRAVMTIQPMLSETAAADQQDAERDEEGDGLLAAGHVDILRRNAELGMQNADRACTTRGESGPPSPLGCRPVTVCILNSAF